MIEIAVDMMGSDLGPETLSEAVKNYAADHKDVAFRCFGDEKDFIPSSRAHPPCKSSTPNPSSRWKSSRSTF